MQTLLSRQGVITIMMFIVGVILGVFLPFEDGDLHLEEEHDYVKMYEFINPLLSCGEGTFNHLGNDETHALEKRLTALIDEQKQEETIVDGGVYFRELNGGPWVGVNFEAKFTPGSLLKVPLAMSVYQLAENEPGFLEREVTYEGGFENVDQHFSATTVTPGTYAVSDLIDSMLINSDNTAAAVLAQIIGKQNLNQAYSRLGIDIPEDGRDYEITVRTYASFFRILYNATYLSRENSEKLLSLLSKSMFTNGIVAGVPKGVVVSHKFGERAFQGESFVQLHDCGIVYHPKQPYLICVMMRGRDFERLAGAIAEVSRVAYESVN